VCSCVVGQVRLPPGTQTGTSEGAARRVCSCVVGQVPLAQAMDLGFGVSSDSDAEDTVPSRHALGAVAPPVAAGDQALTYVRT
jgi:hypothetical protein